MCIDRTTRLVKSQQGASKEYVCVLCLHNDIESEKKLAQTGICMRTMCVHMGLILCVGGRMKELRRVRSGHVDDDDIVTIHDILDAQWMYDNTKNESQGGPTFGDTLGHIQACCSQGVVNAICYSAKLMIPCLLRYESGVEVNEEVVLMTTKG
ncbi:centromere/microtubule-binding protein cbf5 [Mortierella sp. NVP85]|nr:centromere/microtubule-binding protein cbf5 [Mortierella sp. NVP85]